MKIKKTMSRWLSILSTWLTLGFVVYFFISNSLYLEISQFFRPNEQITGIFNSNQLSIAYLYKDLFVHKASFSDWTFSSVPYFFPDTIVFFIIAAIVRNINVAVLWVNALWLVVYYYLLVVVGTSICGEKSRNLFRLSALISILLASGSLGSQEVFVPLWTSHFGSTVLMYLLGLLIILKSFEQEKQIYYIVMGVIVFLTSLSDPYFFALFSGSVFFGFIRLMLNKADSRLLVKMLGIIFLTGILGVLTNVFDCLHLGIDFFHKGREPVSWCFSLEGIIKLQTIFLLYFKKNPIVLLMSLLFFMLGMKLMVSSSQENIKKTFVFITIAFTILISVILSIVMDSDLRMPDFLGLRHFQTSIILPAFLCLPILLTSNENFIKMTNQYYICFLAGIIICILSFLPMKKIAVIYPSVTQCLDHYARKGELMSKNGVAGYWDTHVNDMLSKENLNVVAINKFLSPYNWMSTTHDYLNKRFNFILIRKKTRLSKNVIEKWGKPDQILKCKQDNNYMIYVYNEGFVIQN